MYLDLLLVECILRVVELQLPLLILPGESVLLNLQLFHLEQDAARQPHRPVLLGPAHRSLTGARLLTSPGGWLAGWIKSDPLTSPGLCSGTIRRSL